MWGIVALVLAGLGVASTVIAAAVLAVRVARVTRKLQALPSHPLFEPEWRERQTLMLHRLSANVALLQDDLKKLGESVTRVLAAIEALNKVRRLTATATEDVLLLAVPWLRSLFARSG